MPATATAGWYHPVPYEQDTGDAWQTMTAHARSIWRSPRSRNSSAGAPSSSSARRRRADRGHFDRVARARHCPRRGRHPARPCDGDFRAGIGRQEHPCAAHHGRSPEGRRNRRLHRRRTRHGPRIRARPRHPSRRPPGEPARYRRAGARNLRGAGPLECRRRHRGRLGGRARARAPKSRATWAMRTSVCRRG